MSNQGTEFRYRNANTGELDGSLISIDYAKSAEGYGLKIYTLKTIEELKNAIEDAKKTSYFYFNRYKSSF